MFDWIKKANLDDGRVVFGIFVVAPSFIWIPIVARFFWRRIRKRLGKRGERNALPSAGFEILYVGA